MIVTTVMTVLMKMVDGGCKDQDGNSEDSGHGGIKDGDGSNAGDNGDAAADTDSSGDGDGVDVTMMM